MKQFDYMKSTGSFLEATQKVSLDKSSELFEDVLDSTTGINREKERVRARIEADTELNAEEKAARIEELFAEMISDDPANPEKALVQFRYVAGVLRGRAGVQTQTSIYDTAVMEKFRKLLTKYGMVEHREFENLTFEGINWSAKGRQLPKVLLFATDSTGELCNIRFEAANELAQKILRAISEARIQPGQVFSIKFEAQNPVTVHQAAIDKLEALQAAGVISDEQSSRLEYMKKHPKKEGTVDHVLTLTTLVDGKRFESLGRPPKGEKFQQKMTMEDMEAMFKRINRAIDYKAERVDGRIPSKELPNV